jgi:hypothetical protein
MSDIIEMRSKAEHHSPEYRELLLTQKAHEKHLEEREESAALLVALMQARFSKPTKEEMMEILWCAIKQVVAIKSA